MPDLNFFTPLGLFVRENFLDAQLCCQYCHQMQNVPAMATPIMHGTSKVTDRSLRSTYRSEVSSSMIAEVKQRLLAIKPQLEQHFQLPLNDCQAPSFYRYSQGDFFKPHRDNSGVTNAPQFIKERKLSVIIFLNQQSSQFQGSQNYTYEGGELIFYGLINDSLWENYGFRLPSQPGLLIAFPINIIHEVKPVISGERFTIVSWFI